MKKLLITRGCASLLTLALTFFYTIHAQAQTDGTFKVKGDIGKFYPVCFLDGAFYANVATEMDLGRSNVHLDGDWSGSLISHFSFHTYNYGMGANFINADIRQDFINNPNALSFIGGWRDVSTRNGDRRILIWLRGNTTYYYKSNYAVNPVVYDSLPYDESGIGQHTFKTVIDNYVNTKGMTYNNSAYILGTNNNYFASSVSIGTLKPSTYKLAVEGTIGARRVKVTQESWADFVFEPDYKLPSLVELDAYIKAHKHLPEVPSAEEVIKDGVDVGEMNKILLQKIEELTLHLIEQSKLISQQKKIINEQGQRLDKLEKHIDAVHVK